jgi:hypothetical protein
MVTLDRSLLTYRGFLASSNELRSLLKETGGRWGAGVRTARCELPLPPGRQHQAPGRDCTCGNYGVSTLALARRAAAHTLRGRPLKRRKVVYGVVQMWGGDHDPVALDALRGGGVQVRAPFGQLVALVRSPIAEPVAARLGLPAIDEAVLAAYVADIADGLDAQLVTEALFRQVDVPSPAEEFRAELGHALVQGIRGFWKGLRGLAWGLRHIAPPVLAVALLLVVVPTWWALRTVAVRSWPVVRPLLRRRLIQVGLVVGAAALAIHWFGLPPIVAVVLHAAGEWLRLLMGAAAILTGVVLAVVIWPLQWLRSILGLLGLWRPKW